MSFKTKSTQEIPAEQFDRALQSANQIRRTAVAFRALAVGGSVRTDDLFTGLIHQLFQIRQSLLKAKTTPGIVQYAKDQFDDPAYDIVTEFTTMLSEIDATTGFFETNFPKGPGGHLLIRTFVGDGSGDTVADTITDSGQLTAMIGRLDALIATID